MALEEKNFFKYIEKKFLFENNPKISVSVSGGPDSIALVFLLKKWIKKRNGQLIALIVDHQIRKGSYFEAQYVRKYLIFNNIETRILKISKAKVLEGKMSQARENRFFKIVDYCKKNHIFHLFVGHHYDDNIETFLLRKLAGSNFEGLTAIKEKSIDRKIQIIRPLLNYSKKEILQFNNKNKFSYVKDPSNIDEQYSRVFIRNFIASNPNFLITINREFELVKNNYEDYKKMIFQIFNIICFEIHQNKIVFDLKKFKDLNLEIQTKLIEINYKFFFPKKLFLRYNKIVKVLRILFLNTSLPQNIASMKIVKNENLIYFLL